MTVATQAKPPVHLPPSDEGLFRLDVERYLEIVHAGLLTNDDRIELIDGVLYSKMVKEPPHVVATKQIFAALTAAAPAGWHAAKEDPVRLSASVPEPDCSVLRGGPRDYRARLPGADDVTLVVEVADTSLRRDRTIKQYAYALAGIPIYWLANLVAGRFEVYTDPTGPAESPHYRSCVYYGPDDVLPVVIAGQEVGRIAVKDLLP